MSLLLLFGLGLTLSLIPIAPAFPHDRSHIAGPGELSIPFLAIGLSVVVMTITYFSLVVGELVPKRFALRHPESIAAFIAGPMRFVTKIAAPMVHLLSLSTDALFRLFGGTHVQAPPVTEEEIKALVQKGTEAGVFEESEQDLVEAVFNLGDRSARSLMTPRTQIVWLDLDDSVDAIIAKVVESNYSRFPVSSGNLDQVPGMIHAKELKRGVGSDQAKSP